MESSDRNAYTFLDINETSHDPKTCISQQVMKSLYEMRANNLLCDATIRLEDGIKFNIHRVILSSRSNYFRTLFTTALRNDSKEFKIFGIQSSAMTQIIDYAYLGKCNLTEENVEEMFIISDYVEVLGLLKLCVKFMKKMLRPENCVGLWLFSRSRFSYDLAGTSRFYILCNFIHVTEKSEEFLKLGLNDFYEIISDDMLNAKDEEPVWECCLKWIDYNANERSKYVTKLMSGVRLGLLDTRYFMERVKDHPFVISCEETRRIIIETLTFLYDLDMITNRNDEITTPALALPRLPHEIIIAVGGWSEGHPQTYIETYDTRADRWIRVIEEDPAGPRAYHGTAVIGHKLYCIGGFDGMDYFNTCREFDAVRKTWKEIAPMYCRRCYVSVAELNGLIYALGGYDGHNRQNTAERYDPITNQWTMIASMSIQRSDACACTLNGKVYITGGFNGQECMNTAEYYDPERNTWYPLPNMLSRRSGVSCVAHRGSVYVIGGFNGISRMKTGEKYDPQNEIWTSIQEMYNPRSNFGIEIIDDMIFAIGGFNGLATIAHAECYVVETNEWLEATDMGIIRSALSANVIKGLPNIRDYIHKDRERLLEERRLRMLNNDALNNRNLEVEHHLQLLMQR